MTKPQNFNIDQNLYEIIAIIDRILRRHKRLRVPSIGSKLNASETSQLVHLDLSPNSLDF